MTLLATLTQIHNGDALYLSSEGFRWAAFYNMPKRLRRACFACEPEGLDGRADVRLVLRREPDGLRLGVVWLCLDCFDELETLLGKRMGLRK